MDKEHQAYHVDFEENDEGNTVAVLAPNSACPFCERDRLREQRDALLVALEPIVGLDIALGMGKCHGCTVVFDKARAAIAAAREGTDA